MTLAEPLDYAELVCELVTRRQQVSPKRLTDPGPSPAQQAMLWKAAAQAPDHGLILPWRFVQVSAAAREQLGEAFVQALIERDPQATATQIDDARAKAARAPFLALAISRTGDDDHVEIPATERLVSLGCALQNMLLMAQAQGFGAGLVSGQAMDSAALRTTFALAPNEKAICFIVIGTVGKAKASRVRPSAANFVTTL
ncbi:MAG: nitroreductase family protein [Thiomonas sp.]